MGAGSDYVRLLKKKPPPHPQIDRDWNFILKRASSKRNKEIPQAKIAQDGALRALKEQKER